MATKSRPEVRVYSYKYFVQVNKNGYSQTAESSARREILSTFTGVQNPSWWLQVRYGRNATTAASGTKEQLLGDPFLASMTYVSGTQTVDRLVQGDPHLVDILPPPALGDAPLLHASVANAVLSRFLQKCLAEQRKLQGLVVLGELRKTIQLIRNPLKALEKATHEYVDAVRGRARRLSPRLIPRMITEEYLSYTYGVKPLFYDIKGAYDLCIRLRDLPELVRVRAVAQDEQLVTHTVSSPSYYSIPSHQENVRIVRALGKIVGAVKVQSVGPAPPLMEGLGFQMRDFIPSVYELIPYSFLVDYFTNVGDIINCFSFCQSDLAWHSRTIRTSCDSIVSLSPKRPETVFGVPVTAYSFLPCKARWSNISFTRDGAVLGLPSLAFKMPSFGQGVNIAALAAIRVL